MNEKLKTFKNISTIFKGISKGITKGMLRENSEKSLKHFRKKNQEYFPEDMSTKWSNEIPTKFQKNC